MSKTFQFGNGEWAVGKETVLAYNDENNNFKPLPFTFDRASTATVVNSDGLIETVGVDEPRIDFLNNSKGHLLLEPSRQNLFIYSEDFSEWTPSTGITATGSQTNELTGKSDAYKLEADGSSGFQQLNLNATTSGTNTLSLFAKKGTNNTISLRGLTAIDTRVIANLETGEIIGSTNVVSTKIEDYGNDWYRISLTYDGSNVNFYIYPFTLGTADAGFVYIYGAQLEAGSYATSYIPTSGSAVTRSGETCNDAGNSQVINSEEGVLYIEASALANDLSERRFSISDGTSSNVVRVGYTNVSNRIIAVIYNGTNQAVLTYTPPDITVNSKIAVKYKANDFALWVDGVKRSTDISGITFASGTLNSVDFNVGGVNHFFSKTKDVRVYNTALSDSELQALTS